MLAGKNYFTTLDLLKGYYQIPMHKDSIEKTAIITPFECFEFLQLPFGVMNASSNFQRLIDTVLDRIPFVFKYLDDVIIASPTLQDHMQDVKTVLDCL